MLKSNAPRRAVAPPPCSLALLRARAWSLGLLASVALLLAACGGSESEKSEPASKPTGYVAWPIFGRTPERTHYLPAHERVLDPPLKEAWSVSTHGLIEFPPAIHGGVAYLINKYGNGKAVRLRDRKVLWEPRLRKRNHGRPSFVTAPVYYRGRVHGAFLGGTLVAGNATTGREEWHRELHAHLESSPVAAGGNLYLGTDASEAIAVSAGDGSALWRFDSPAAIKASPSFDRGRLFVADCQSSVFALDARTGRVRWSYEVGGPVPGTAAVIGHTVYVSSFQTQRTVGLDVLTHRRTFELHQAGYTPVVSDGKRPYLVGYFDLIGLQPTEP